MFKFGKLLNEASEKITTDTILVSPINVSIIITLIMIIIIYFVSYGELETVYEDQNINKLWLKIGFFTFISNTIILFLSHSNIMNKYKMQYKSQADQHAIRYINSSIENTITPES